MELAHPHTATSTSAHFRPDMYKSPHLRNRSPHVDRCISKYNKDIMGHSSK